MFRVRQKHFNSMIYFAFVLCMVLAVSIFFVRVVTESDVTEMPVGQVILTSFEYELGAVMDRNGEAIVNGNGDELVWKSEEVRMAFEDILGVDIEETLGSQTTVLGNCPWVFGAEDNRFTLDHLICPYEQKTGGSVRLTMDCGLQEYVYGLIADSGCENAYVVVSNYKTGEILAIYGDVFSNTLHPGSTLKPVLAAIALYLKPELADYTYNCIPENHIFQTNEGLREIHCAYGVSHGPMDMQSALAYSCNGYFISLMQQVDKNEMLNALKEWGFDTTISYSQFMYWDHSFVKESKRETDYLFASIGQANALITPAGLNFCMNALLNHGELVEPVWYTEKRTSSDSEWRAIDNPGSKRMCSAELADAVVSMMKTVTETGTGTSFYLPGFAAKTGTAQKSDGNGNLSGLYTVWTTGGLTDEESPYSITVCLDDVTEDMGSGDAGIIARNILLYMTEGEY